MGKNRLETDVLIIGGGITGTGILRDLSLRGIDCALVERDDINSGASGGNHGLLHSGARYVYKDIAAAIECKNENKLLKRNAPHCVEETGGIFAAFRGDDETYISDFPRYCQAAGVRCEALDIKDARLMEPELSDQLIAAFLVDDATVDPFKLSLENVTQSLQLGSSVFCDSEVVSFDISRRVIKSAQLQNRKTGKLTEIRARQFVNAGGAWSGEIAEKAGCSLELLLSKGTLLVTHQRITERVINRLRPPSDADILVPGGSVSIVGTTSLTVQSPEKTYPTADEVDLIVNDARTMIPTLDRARYIRAYTGIRPLVSSGKRDVVENRNVSREFSLLDHLEDGLDNFLTITGGKLTTFRNMAEKTADQVCDRLCVDVPCSTRTEPLPVSSTSRWTEPGFAPKHWVSQKKPDDLLLCECEMVPQSAVDEIAEDLSNHHLPLDLIALGLRSRIGKGTCQGSFCGARIVAYLYERLKISGDSGIHTLKNFLRNRWRGEKAILWNHQLAQSELSEAIQCGFLSLESVESKTRTVSLAPVAKQGPALT